MIRLISIRCGVSSLWPSSVLLLLSSHQCVVYGLSRVHLPTLIRHGDRQNADFVVIRQCQRLGIRRHIEEIGKQVGIGIRLISAVGGMAMRGKPRHGRALDKARRKALILQHNPGPRRLLLGPGGTSGRGAWWRHRHLHSIPKAVVPLTAITPPSLDREFDRGTANAESGLLVALPPGRPHVQAGLISP